MIAFIVPDTHTCGMVSAPPRLAPPPSARALPSAPGLRLALVYPPTPLAPSKFFASARPSRPASAWSAWASIPAHRIETGPARHVLAQGPLAWLPYQRPLLSRLALSTPRANGEFG